MCFTWCCDARCIFGKSDGCLDCVSLYITRSSNTEFLYGKSVCAELTGWFVSLYITRSSNTKSRYGKSVCEKLTWKICYLIYHAVIEHRAGTREDIADDIDDYVDPKIIIFDQVISASLLSFLLEIILGHQVIRSSSPSILSDHLKRKLMWITWRELSAFILFWVYFLVHVYTLVSGVHTVFYKPCWWVYMVEWTL